MEPTVAQLDTLIMARLALIGVDLDDLPVDDPAAPADQVRLMESLRAFLRRVPAEISEFPMDPQLRIPVLYPAEFMTWTSTQSTGKTTPG